MYQQWMVDEETGREGTVARYRNPPVPLYARVSHGLDRHDSFSTTSMSVAECLDYILYKLCTDINLRTWMHPERKNDRLVNGDAFLFLRTSWSGWNLSITDARSMVDFVMRRVAYLRDLDELITQIKKFYSTPFSHMPISFIDAATRESRFGRVPGPGYRCDLCGGAHLKERCPRLLRPARIRLEVIGIAQFRCDSCGREWRSDRCGRDDITRSCIRCRRYSYRRWFVETCSETCDRHCMRLTHLECRANDVLMHTALTHPMQVQAHLECRVNDSVTHPMLQSDITARLSRPDALVEPSMIASYESSAHLLPPATRAPAVVSYISTSIVAHVEVGAPLPAHYSTTMSRPSHPPLYRGSHPAVHNDRDSSAHHRPALPRPTSLPMPPPNHAQWHAENLSRLDSSHDTPWFLPPYYEPTTVPTRSPPPAYSAVTPPRHSRLDSSPDRGGQPERSRISSLFTSAPAEPATTNNSRLESSLDLDDPTDQLADLLEFWDRYLAI